MISIDDKIKNARLIRFGHISRRSVDAPARRCEQLDHSEHKRGRGRLKKSWSEVIRDDLKTLGSVEEMTQNRRLRRFRIKIADFK